MQINRKSSMLDFLENVSASNTLTTVLFLSPNYSSTALSLIRAPSRASPVCFLSRLEPPPHCRHIPVGDVACSFLLSSILRLNRLRHVLPVPSARGVCS